jgi:hypothetical protein
MRSVVLFFLVLSVCPFLRAQSPVFASRVIEYRPAPGQYINDPVAGTPDAAGKTAGRVGEPLSLGAYGGYIVYGFNKSVENDPGNPYGVDLIVYGNASATHSEPGIIRLMKDENGNGLPDDTWYEIAGNEHFSGDFIKNYSIEYSGPGTNSGISWDDNTGETGIISTNSFHSQPYYPLNTLFPAISKSSLTFTGSMIHGHVGLSGGMYVSLPAVFGYADNTPVTAGDLTGIPDNPYTPGTIEGDGGDAIDISWAVDAEGNYVSLPEIDFVMIYTGVNASAGWLGEISTEVRGIADVAPDNITSGTRNLIIPAPHAGSMLLSESLELTANVFLSGRFFAGEKIVWNSQDEEIISISGNRAFGLKTGQTLITAALASDPSVKSSFAVSVVIPGKIVPEKSNIYLSSGETLCTGFRITDNTGALLTGLMPIVSSSDMEVAEVISSGTEDFTIRAGKAGICTLRITLPGSKDIIAETQVEVSADKPEVNVNFSMSDDRMNFIQAKNYLVHKQDILEYTDRYSVDSYTGKPYISLADAIASVLSSEGYGSGEKSFAFRQDEFGGEGFYLWQVGYNWEYRYGWGGSKKSSTYANTWFAIVNNKVFATGFDTVRVNEGDKISLHHINDNGAAWKFTRILPLKTEVTVSEQLSFHCEELEVLPSGDYSFSVSGPFPVTGRPVRVDRDAVDQEASELVTDNSGDFMLSFSNTGDHTVSVDDSDPVLISVGNPLGTTDRTVSLNLYPNPCSGLLRLSRTGTEQAFVRIFSTDGSLKYSTLIGRGSSETGIDLSGLSPGVYILDYYSSGKSARVKIYRQ